MIVLSDQPNDPRLTRCARMCIVGKEGREWRRREGTPGGKKSTAKPIRKSVHKLIYKTKKKDFHYVF